MRELRRLRWFLFVVMLVLYSCDKDEVDNTGNEPEATFQGTMSASVIGLASVVDGTVVEFDPSFTLHEDNTMWLSGNHPGYWLRINYIPIDSVGTFNWPEVFFEIWELSSVGGTVNHQGIDSEITTSQISAEHIVATFYFRGNNIWHGGEFEIEGSVYVRKIR